MKLMWKCVWVIHTHDGSDGLSLSLSQRAYWGWKNTERSETETTSVLLLLCDSFQFCALPVKHVELQRLID